ncbi:hypothetical protein O3M35_001475 [Rhynocoris fuscipes]|uniref:DNA helicase n=1 Tax=Rhynocoris fuscipes TaxID=488301 RepID=A0AAW1CP38_9HEMI
MKTASKNKQNTLANFFTKVPKSLPLNECSNTLKSLKVNALKTDKDVIDLTDESLKNDENICTNKRKIEQDENLCLKKNKTDDNDDERAIISNSSLKQTKQKTIDEFNFNDIDDEFFMDNISFNDECYSNLDFSKLERYKVENVEITSTNDIKLTVENLMLHNKGICVVKSPWNACTIHKGDVVSIQGRLCKTEEQPYWVVDWNGGLLVTNSDHLISGTTVVNSLYCSRKTVLSHMFKEQDCLPQGSKAMFIGCTVHQLLQEALSNKKTTLEEIEELFNKMKSSKDFKMQLFLENFNADEIEEEIQHFIPRIHNFMCKYVNYEDSKFHNTNQRNNTPKLNGNWQGEIVEVKDIEENIWSHKLGVKGKVDATVRVNVHNKIKTVPLELKTGKVSPLNLEHRGQVILYCMMLQELGENVDNGLLLYLRDEGHMIDVKFAEKEKRDLILLRNGLSGWLKNLTLVEPSNNISAPNLPKVINRNTCQSCPQLIACSAALRRSGDIDQLKEKHINKSLAEESTKHLTGQHLDYIFHWLGLLSLEFQMSKFSISRIWSFKPEEREAKGWCISNLKVSRSSAGKGGRWEHCLQKQNESTIISSIEKGQCVIIGNNSNIAIAMGSVIDVANNSVSVILDKDIKGFNAPIYLDIYESSSINQILMNNIGILLQNTGRADSLRKHIIEAKVPGFAAKLSSKIKKHGEDIFERLNKEQVRAILQAIAAEKYILIKGLPGAGKTTTMRALIELLARMGKKVLVTSFTHSAIDNILLGLPLLQTGDVLRLGSLRRIHPQVACFAAEDKILEDLGTNISTEMLNNAYAKKKVVGVTCLGCCHPWLERQNFDVCLVDEATQVTQAAVI